MDAMTAPALTVVIAVKGGQGNLAAILERLSGVDPRTVEILFCAAGPAPDALKPASARHRVIAAEEAALVPHLWRDGLLAAMERGRAFHTEPDAPLTVTECEREREGEREPFDGIPMPWTKAQQ